jgi:hypothetical protein
VRRLGGGGRLQRQPGKPHALTLALALALGLSLSLSLALALALTLPVWRAGHGV